MVRECTSPSHVHPTYIYVRACVQSVCVRPLSLRAALPLCAELYVGRCHCPCCASVGRLPIDGLPAMLHNGPMTKTTTTAPIPCPMCESTRYDDDLAFADGTGYVCPSCDSNVFTDDDN